ncbi:RNA pseudouridylate synthase domain containing protein 2 [Arachnomyces sp. PD_36]|nr:RNA pseudouridylate synthase domain containing protein 2 [Arachnomyces sp. PD_36]
MADIAANGANEPEDPNQTSTTVIETPCDPWPEPYYLEGGLRRVAPYYFAYKTYCKERWRGREIGDVFSTEFRDRSQDYYINAIKNGGVTINGNAVSPETRIKNGDLISHTLHRHEPPVTSLPIGIIHEDEGMIVIDKPAGVPVHPTGRYNHNSVTKIMGAERGNGFKPLPCNRLDRLTSGVMFIGKDPKAAEAMALKLQNRSVQKEYVTRVRGKFPDGVIVCDQPIMHINPMLGLNRARQEGKEAKTKFRRLAYYPPKSRESRGPLENTETDGPNKPKPLTPPPASESEGYSIVHCLPFTGRTHQLRVHLQFLGHPISNDPIYSNQRVFGPNLGRYDNTGDYDKEIIERLSRVGKTETAEAGISFYSYQTELPPLPAGADPAAVDALIMQQHDEMAIRYQKRKGEKMSGKKCEVCDTDLYTDPGVEELGIFLHAAAYADLDGKWKYRSKLPAWALPADKKLEDGDNGVPDWVDVDESEEILICGPKRVAPVEGDEESSAAADT